MLRVSQVGHMVKRTVRLVNQSDGGLRYSLACLADPEPGTAADAAEPCAQPVQFLGNALAAEGARTDEFWVSEPEGTLTAR